MIMTRFATISLFIAALATPISVATGEDRKIDLANDKAYDHVVKPILANRCYTCHGEEKKKGKLQLHTPDAIKAGAAGDAVVVAGKKGDSSMFERIMLPDDDEDVMPPEDKPRLTDEQKKVIGWWIDQGASFDKKISDLTVPDDIKTILAGMVLMKIEKKAVSKDVADAPEPAAPAVVDAIEKSGMLIMPLAQNTTFLTANAINVAKEFGDEQLKLLPPAATQMRWLDISKTQVSDAGMGEVGKLGALTRLHLENTGVTDASLPHVGKLANLEYLNLYGTKVTDAGLEHLKNLKNLKKLFVWQTGVTEAGAKKLAEAIPGIDVNLGWKEPAPKEGEEKKEEEKK